MSKRQKDQEISVTSLSEAELTLLQAAVNFRTRHSGVLASRLNRAENTVRAQFQSTIVKLGQRDRLGAVVEALEQRLILLDRDRADQDRTDSDSPSLLPAGRSADGMPQKSTQSRIENQGIEG